MTLSIIDSMLRGDLRRQFLTTKKTEKEISLLWRDLMKSFTKGDKHLISIEEALTVAVENSGLVCVSEDFKYDREVLEGAENARKQGICLDENNYTKVEEVLSLDGVFDSCQETTPTDKFLHLLIKVECQRTVQFLLSLVESVHDDAVVRTYIRQLFSTITSFCKDANDLYIKESLTQLYFEVYHTFRILLEKNNSQQYETDFENFIFEWKGEFPDKKVVEKYNEIINVKANEVLETPNLPQLEDVPKLTTGAMNFVNCVGLYGFEDLPLVKVLNAKQQAELIELIVKDACYAAAMLKHIGYYERLKKVYQMNKNEVIINHCADSLKCSRSTFRKYFYSLDSPTPEYSYERHNAKAFLDNNQVQEDYDRIKETKH